MAPGFKTQLWGLLWRNCLIKKRKWIQSFLEVFLPVLVMAFMVFISTKVDKDDSTPVITDFASQNFTPSAFFPYRSASVVVNPGLPFMSDVIGHVSHSLNITPRYIPDHVVSERMDDLYRKSPNFAEVGLEILWKPEEEGVISIEGYVLRVPHEMVKELAKTECPYERNREYCGRAQDSEQAKCPARQALTSGVVSLQWALETALVKTFIDENFEPPSLQFQMMPVPAYRPGVSKMQLLFCLLMIAALTPLAYFVTVTMVTERETRARVTFKLMGLRKSVFWLSWWLLYLLVVLVLALVGVAVVGGAGLLTGSALPFLLLLLLGYGASLLGLAGVLSGFTNSPKVAGALCSTLTLLFALLYLAVCFTRPPVFSFTPQSHVAVSRVPFGAQLVLSVLSPLAFSLGLDQMMHDHEEGLESGTGPAQFPLLAAVLMLWLDAVLYALLALYLDHVLPSKVYHYHKPWFLFLPSYWRKRRDEDRDFDVIPTDTPEGPHIQPLTEDIASGTAIRIRDLSKAYGSGDNQVFGLNGVDVDICEGQVTCILGHPGAGKTTLINVVAGVTAPTSGQVYVYDLNASCLADHDELSSTVALCPQPDAFLGDVTVLQHLTLTSLLRGINSDTAAREICSLLAVFRLETVKKKLTGELSGCQKRRLSVATALLANTKVLLLDEPTLGMGLEERQKLWELLHSRKSQRVILFTSRHIQEADFFADRTVVLSTGRLRCVGSSLFLKQHFNVGYLLHVTVRPGTSTDRLLRAVRAHVRGARLVRVEDEKVTIAIPSLQAAKLTDVFRKLESKERGADYLGVVHFEISMSTLQQVFWKLAEEEEAGQVFISPLLTPSDEVFHQAISEESPQPVHRDSLFASPLPRPKTLAHMEDLHHRFSLLPLRRPHHPAEAAHFPRKSEHPHHQHLAQYQRSVSDCDKPHTRAEAVTRRLSSMLLGKGARPSSTSSNASVPEHPHPTHQGNPATRHSSIIAETLHKFRKDRAKSLGGPLRKSNTSHELSSQAEHQENGIEETPGFNGTALPTSVAGRRMTATAMQMIRSVSHGNLLTPDYAPSAPDPMVRAMSVLDNVEQAQARKASETPSSLSRLSSVSSPVEEVPAQEKDVDRLKRVQRAKFGEVLARMSPAETGVQLSAVRFLTMLKLRGLVCVGHKCRLLLRVLLSVLLTLVAVGLSHAVFSASIASDPPQEIRTPLFGLNRSLVYRNRTGQGLDGLLSEFSRNLEGMKHVSQYTSPAWESPGGLNSLLDVLSPNGSAYKIFYNASCAVALPHLTTFVTHIMRGPPVQSAVNPGNNASLAPRLEAFLLPWPALERDEDWGLLHWVPALFLGLALLFTPSAYADRMLRERRKKIREYMGICGVGPIIFYGTALIVDVLEFLVPAILLVVLSAVSEMVMFEVEGAMDCLILLMILSVPVSVLWAYVTSFCFSSPRTCWVVNNVFLALMTVGMFLLVHFLDVEDTAETANTLHYVFCILWPPYIRFGALHYIARAESKEWKETPTSVFFDFDSDIDICFIMLLVDIVVLSCVVLLLDKLTFRAPPIRCSRSKTKTPSVRSYDGPGVEKEVKKVEELRKSDKSSWPLLVVDKVSKVFTGHQRSLAAVKDASLTIQAGEVLGLLGPRGAGKSTLADLLLGVYSPSGGSVHINSPHPSPELFAGCCQRVGLCPQYNPLWDCLTVDQHVTLVGRVWGLHKHDLVSLTQCLYHDLDLEAYHDHKTCRLSDGEKRKLCFAMSMLGTHSMTILDQPTSGMEPRSRMMYWDAVKHFVAASGRGTVINTHSTVEAHTLCSRLAIMVNGQIRCVGSVSELEEHCHSRYRLEVSLGEWSAERGAQRMEMLTMFLKELFPGITPIQHFQQRAVFSLPATQQDFSWSKTFDTLESLKRNLGLEDFTFSQTSLDQLFLDMAEEQAEGEGRYQTPNDPLPLLNVSSKPALSSPDSVTLEVPDPEPLPPRDPEGEGGASSQAAVSHAHAAEGVVNLRHPDKGGGAGGEEEEGGATEVGAATPVVFHLELEGVDNPAYVSAEDEGQNHNTSVL